MAAALELAQIAARMRETPVGAIVVRERENHRKRLQSGRNR